MPRSQWRTPVWFRRDRHRRLEVPTHGSRSTSCRRFPPAARDARRSDRGHPIRLRMDQSPVAFRLLPPTFTLSELQHMYELLLGKAIP